MSGVFFSDEDVKTISEKFRNPVAWFGTEEDAIKFVEK